MMKTLYKGLVLPLVVLLTAVFLSACQPGTAGEADALKSEVIKVHDRIMPRTAELIKLKAELSGVITGLDSLKQAHPEADTALIHKKVDSLTRALDAADNAMSEWMHDFKTDYSGMEHQQIMDYLNKEKIRIAGIEQAYEESIGGAQALLDRVKGSGMQAPDEIKAPEGQN